MAIVPYTGQDEFGLANQDQDCRGWNVVDTQGRRLGAVAELLVDTDARRVDSVVLDTGERIPASAITLRGGVVEVNVVAGRDDADEFGSDEILPAAGAATAGATPGAGESNTARAGTFLADAPPLGAASAGAFTATNPPPTDSDRGASRFAADASRDIDESLTAGAPSSPASHGAADARAGEAQARERLRPVDELLGKSIISRSTGNKLGHVQDLIIDPVEGVVLGLAARTPDERTYVIDRGEVYSYGPDAVMVNSDESVSMLESSPLVGPPLAKKDLTGTKIITESGKLLGEVANLFVLPSATPLVVYEIRESLLDKLLGRARYMPASLGRAMSEKAERIVVPDDAEGLAADSLEACAARLPPSGDEETMVSSRGGAASDSHL